jgi:hypothetical protein
LHNTISQNVVVFNGTTVAVMIIIIICVCRLDVSKSVATPELLQAIFPLANNNNNSNKNNNKNN